jgi:hypothetical protein
MTIMTANPKRSDWAGSAGAYAVAWGLPMAAIVLGLFAGVPARTAIWSLALAWMGAACLLNARRCGRTHCRYTGPYYIVMIVPVTMAGMQLVPLKQAGWILLAVAILVGGKLIRWVSERVWGTYL